MLSFTTAQLEALVAAGLWPALRRKRLRGSSGGSARIGILVAAVPAACIGWGTVAGADDKAKRKARVAAYVLARELGQSLEAIAARYDTPVAEVDEAVTAWGADAMCAIRSTSDLGVPVVIVEFRDDTGVSYTNP